MYDNKGIVYVGSCKASDTICIVIKIFNYNPIFISLIIFFSKKLYGTYDSKQYIYLSCATSCDLYSGFARVCCQSDNCNTVSSEISTNTTGSVASCYKGGSLAITDTTNDIPEITTCPAGSSSYCGVC